MALEEELNEFLDKKRFKEGLNRTEKLLKKQNADPLITVYKARFLDGLGQTDKATAAVAALAERRPPITHAGVLDGVDNFLLERNQVTTGDLLTAGPLSLTLWKNAAAATKPSFLLDLLRDRFDFAAETGRLEDAHHALTQWRKLQPDRKGLRFGHAVIHHLISQKTADPGKKNMFSLLAIRTAESLAPQAESDAEVETVVNILSQQTNSGKKLIDLLRANETFDKCLKANSTALMSLLDYLDRVDREELQSLTHSILRSKKCPHLLAHGMKFWKMWTKAQTSLTTPELRSRLRDMEWTDHRLSLVTHLYALTASGDAEETIYGILQEYYIRHGHGVYFFADVKQALAALPPQLVDNFRKWMAQRSREFAESANSINSNIISYEITALRIEYMVEISKTTSIEKVLAFSSLLCALSATDPHGELSWLVLMIVALLKAHGIDPSGRYLLAAFCFAEMLPDNIYSVKVLLTYIGQALGIPALALFHFLDLGVKEVQLDTASHIGLTRMSIQDPGTALDKLVRQKDPNDLLNAALKMYQPTIIKVSEQASSCLHADRPNMMLELDALRTKLDNSIQRRLLLLELRRTERLRNHTPNTDHVLKVSTTAIWTENLADNRDYSTCENFEHSQNLPNLERRICFSGKIPNAAYIDLHLWIDSICSLISNHDSLARDRFSLPPPEVTTELRAGCTDLEIALIPAWSHLATAAALALLPPPTTTTQDPKPKPDALQASMSQLNETLETLPLSFDAKTAVNPDLNTILPASEGLQKSYLTLDLLKTIHRFTVACGDVRKKRRAGTPVDPALVKTVADTAEAQFQTIQDYAREMRLGISAESMERIVKETRDWIVAGRPGASSADVEGGDGGGQNGRWAGDDQRLTNAVHGVARAARGAWHSVASVKLEG